MSEVLTETEFDTVETKDIAEERDETFLTLKTVMRKFVESPNARAGQVNQFIKLVYDVKTKNFRDSVINNMVELLSAFREYQDLPPGYTPGIGVGGNGQNSHDHCRSLTGELVGFSKHICGEKK